MRKLPFVLPSAYKTLAGQAIAPPDVDTGGYDIMIGGLGFRLATDQTYPFTRSTEPSTVRRFDVSNEPGEQSLTPLPWIKSQTSFHGGAGQVNLESALVAFQYQQEQISHIRYDTSLGVDPWTIGVVKRLPDTVFSNFGFTASAACTANVAGIDYAVVGGVGNLYQLAWLSGPDAAPTVTALPLTNGSFGGASNCNITSLDTDGTNYYGVLQLTALGTTPGIYTYIISGKMASTNEPTALYEVPFYTSFIPRTNLCTNPNFETDLSGWTAGGTATPTIAQSAVVAHSGTKSCLVTATGASTFFEGNDFTFTTVIGTTYTVSGYVYIPASGGVPLVSIVTAGNLGSQTAVTGSWQRISLTFTATVTSTQIAFYMGGTVTAGKIFYMDDVLIEQAGGVNPYFDGGTAADANYTYAWTGVANESTSNATPILAPNPAPGVVGFVKARLIAGMASSVYELPTNVPAHSQLPSPKYTHPVTVFLWSSVAESPTSILLAGASGLSSQILKFSLDTSGGTPTLSGGASVEQLPAGEQVNTMLAVQGSFLAIGTNKGVRVATFDTYTGALVMGPLTLLSNQPVVALGTRDRFVFAGYTNQQPDGKTGLARIDLSMQIDAGGRLAWAPDLRPPSTAPTGLGAVTAVHELPGAGRLLFLTPEGIHVEGNGPGTDTGAKYWLRTSRIRFDTEEKKLFKLGGVLGALDAGTISVIGTTPYGGDSNLGTFGFLNNQDPGEFRLPNGLNTWLKLRFNLDSPASQLNSYHAKALPAPQRQHIIEFTVNCFRNEEDRFGLSVTDPKLPRDRYNAVRDLEASGQEQRFVEFTPLGPVAQLVVIDQIIARSDSRPTIENDFGGYITFKLRATEN